MCLHHISHIKPPGYCFTIALTQNLKLSNHSIIISNRTLFQLNIVISLLTLCCLMHSC